MYIKYYRNQKSADPEDQTKYRLSLTGGKYRPTWLIRISDWEKVSGDEAVNGYHTLSYCWEQSGEVVSRNDDSGEYDCIDDGYHCIVDDNIEEINEGENVPNNTIERNVTYEELLQQVCKDFQVQYLWYDKECIDQSDKETKLKEIKQMHRIYSNACYTIVMAPDVQCPESVYFEEEMPQYGNYARWVTVFDFYDSYWMKRSWTLEEVMMSKRILMIGTDINFFQHSLHTTTVPSVVDNFSSQLLDFRGEHHGQEGSVNQALNEAHFRTSTKPHDMIFALANTFSHMFDDIDIDYETDIKTTFNTFYQHIGTEDLSILCFGSNQEPNHSRTKQSTMDDYNLPSWCGVAGRHTADFVNTTIHSQLTYCIDVETMHMNITTNRYWKIPIAPYIRGCFSTLIYGRYIKDTFSKLEKYIMAARIRGNWTDLISADEDTVLQEWSTNMRIASTVLMTHFYRRPDDPLSKTRPLSLTEDCEECIVLPILLKSYTADIKVVGNNDFNRVIDKYIGSYFLPVFSKNSDDDTEKYKAVGIYYLGEDRENSKSPTFNWTHFVGMDDSNPQKNPEEILDILFENDHYDVPREFIIE